MKINLRAMVRALLLCVALMPTTVGGTTAQSQDLILKDGLVYQLQKNEAGDFNGTVAVVNWADTITELNIPSEVELDIPETEPAYRQSRETRRYKVIIWFTHPGQYLINPGDVGNIRNVIVDPDVCTRGTFAGYARLVQANLSDVETEIADSMFMNCTALETFTVPKSANYIGIDAFGGCTSLKTVNFPAGNLNISYGAYRGCTTLESISIPAGSHVSAEAFDGCSNLKQAFFANDCNVYGNPFTNCPNLTDVKVESNYSPRLEVRDGSLLIDKQNSTLLSAFPSTISQATIPADVRQIGQEAFAYCKNLKSIVIPYSIESIGYQAFLECGLESLDTDQLTGFGDTEDYGYQFQRCQNLKKVYIGKNMKNLPARAFWECNSLTEFIVAPENEAFTAKDGAVYNQAGTKLICCPPGLDTFNVAEGTETIGDAAFCGSGKLAGVNLPQSIGWIGDNAFQDCSALKEVTIPDNVYGVWSGTFCGCSSLETLTLGKGMKQLRDWAFNGCNKLTTLNVLATEPPHATFSDEEDEIFPEHMLHNTVVYVPDESLPKYKESSLWSRFSNLRGSLASISETFGNSEIKIYSTKNTIVIESANEHTVARIYGINGNLIYSGKDKQIHAEPGLYIVDINGNRQKILVK